LLLYAVLVFLVAVSAYICSGSKKYTQPNIVLILTDDQGWGDLSINGNKNVQTPHIDSIGLNGLTFENFFVQPVCSPTRAELLTGRYSARTGVYSTSAGGERIDLDEITLAEVLKENGYATGCFGKWHSGMQYPYHPLGRGFDEFYGFASGHWGNYFSPILEHNGNLVRGEGYLSDDLTTKAIDFISNHREQSFFVYLPYNIPHSPMSVPDDLWNRWKDVSITQTGTLVDQQDVDKTRASLAMCENIDNNVGRLKAKLRELGLEENTMIIYLSDNGPNGHRWNGEMKGIKGSTDDGGVKSPLMVQWKGRIKPNVKIKGISSAIDILPTLAAITRSKYLGKKHIDGKDMSSVWLDQTKNQSEKYVINNWRDQVSIRSQKYRLDKDNHLYAIEVDPSQSNPVTSLYPEVYLELTEQKEWFEKNVLSELPNEDDRPFLIGHPDFHMTQLPARDGVPHGNIKRSNRWPNCSYFTNWTSSSDSITWDVEVLSSGQYKVQMYYTIPEAGVGSEVVLRCGDAFISKSIEVAHDPPLIGMKYDRGKPRGESYVKDFRSLEFGEIDLSKGRCKLVLKSDELVGESGPDFRLLMFERV